MRLLMLFCSCGVQLLSGLGGNQNIKSINIGAVSGLGGNLVADAQNQESEELICQLGGVAGRRSGLVKAAIKLRFDRSALAARLPVLARLPCSRRTA